MTSTVVQGRYIVTATVGVTIAMALMLRSIPLLGLGTVGVVLVLISLCLFDGQSWARWVLGSVLSLLGGVWSIQALMLLIMTAGTLTVLPFVFLTVAFGSLVSGVALMLSKHVRDFVRHRKAERNAFVHKALIVCWVLVGIILAKAIVSEIVPQLGP